MNQDSQDSYTKLSDILDIIKNAHQQVASFCIENDIQFDNEQETLLADSLKVDQLKIENAITMDAKKMSLENDQGWIQYIPEKELMAAVKTVIESQSPTLDELIERIQDFYQAASSFLETIREQAPSERSIEIFDNLILLEKQNAIALSNRQTGLRDV